MRRMRTGLVASLEELNDPAPTPAEDTAGDGAENLETEVLEVNDSAAEGEAQDAKTDNAEEAVEALESIADFLRASAAAGGLDKNAAGAVSVGVDFACAKAGIYTRTMPAMESFGGTSSRVGQTTLALENVKEKIQEIWKAIMAAIQKAVKWVVDHYNAVFGAAEKLGKRADALETKAEGTKGTAKEKTFENDRLGKALYVGTAVPSSPSAVLGKLTAIYSGAAVNEEGFAALEEIVKGVEEFSADGKTLESFEAPAFKPAGGEQAVSDPTKEGFGDVPNGLTLYRSDELFGGRAIISVGPSAAVKGVAAVDAVAKSGVSLGKFNPNAKVPSSLKLTTLSTSEAAKVAKEVASLAVSLKKFREQSKKVEALAKRIESAAKKMESKKADAEGEAREVIKAAQKFASASARSMTAPAGVATYGVNTGKALLDYVELSLKQYKED